MFEWSRFAYRTVRRFRLWTVRRALVFGEDPAIALHCSRLRTAQRALVFGEDPASTFAFYDSDPVIGASRADHAVQNVHAGQVCFAKVDRRAFAGPRIGMR